MLALFLGVRTNLPQFQSAKALPVPHSNDKAKKDKIQEVPGVWDVLCQLNPSYGATRYLKQYDSPTIPKHGDSTCLKKLEAKSKPTVVSVVATVPDPVHTHLGLGFDRAIDAIQAAAGEASYVPYANAVPWPPPGEKSDKQDTVGPGEYEYPGLLLFRRSAAPAPRNDYLAVFLVPESPTSGIDRTSFLTAARIMETISPGSTKPIHMAGPNFSGSVPLLPDLEKELQKSECIAAISGSVTNAKNPIAWHTGHCASSFVPIQTSDVEAIQSFMTEMCNTKPYKAEDIAILTEEGTEYGLLGHAGGRPCALDRALRLHFPREMSRLRNASAPIQTKDETGKTSKIVDSSQQLNWQDSHPVLRDDIRNYGEQTPLSEQLVLSTLATTIKSKNIKLLGILATDPLDTAFLVHSFKQSCPDVRLFLRDPDLLYLRTPDVASLNGVLAINNFPLIPQNQFWKKDEGQDGQHEQHVVTLPSSAQEGQYNAFTLLLANLPVKTEFPDLLEVHWPGEPTTFDLQKPDIPLWVVTAGTTGYYPISLLNAAGHAPSQSIRSLNVGGPPYATILLWIVISLVGLLQATWTAFPRLAPERFANEVDFSDKRDAITALKASGQFMALMIVALASYVSGSSFVFFKGAPYEVGNLKLFPVLGVAVRGVTLMILSAALLLFFRSVLVPWLIYCFPSLSKQKQLDLRNAKAVSMHVPLISTVVMAAVLVGFFKRWPLESYNVGYENAFLNFRNLRLSSGVAPIIPILLLLGVFYIGIWVYVRRISDWEYGSVKMADPTLDSVFRCRIEENVKAIDESMIRGPEKHWSWIALCVSVCCTLAFRPWATMEMMEASWVQRFLWYCFAMALLVLWMNWFRFMVIWRRLRSILQNLERLPLRSAFNRLPRETLLPILRWSVRDENYLPMCEAVDTLRALVRADATAISWRNREELLSCVRQLSDSNSVQVQRSKQPQAFPARFDMPLEKAAGAENMSAGNVTGANPEAGTSNVNPIPLTNAPAEKALRYPSKWRIMAWIRRAWGALRARLHKGEDNRRESTAPRPRSMRETKELIQKTRKVMTSVIEELAPWLLMQYWNRGRAVPSEPENIDPVDRKYLLAEDLIAMRFYTYIRYVVSELRDLLFFIVLAFCLLFVALHTYAFRADHSIDSSFIVLFVVLSVGVGLVLAEMERDPLLSRLAGSKAGELNKGFYVQLLKYGIVPLLTIISSQVPSISNVLLRWVQPTLETLR